MGNSLEQALKRCDFGGRALPLFAPFNAFLHLLTPYRLPGKDCLSGVGRFLKVLGGASLSPIRRTDMKLHRVDFSPMQFIQTPTHELLISVEYNDILR